jgi:hypothetical protein
MKARHLESLACEAAGELNGKLDFTAEGLR